MGKFHDTENSNRTKVEQPDIRVSVTNLGPIKSGSVDLRPLTIFVGPSNTGKTYFAILIYALRGILEWISAASCNTFSYQHRFNCAQECGGLDLNESHYGRRAGRRNFEGYFKRVGNRKGRPVQIFRLGPKSVRDIAQAVQLMTPDSLGADFRDRTPTLLRPRFRFRSSPLGPGAPTMKCLDGCQRARQHAFGISELEVSGAEITTTWTH